MNKHRKNILLSVFPTIILSFILCSSCGKTKPIALENSKYDVLAETLNDWVKKGELVGAELLILVDEKPVIHQAFGWSDLESGKTLEKDAVWTVMSMTKPFTATAILMLMEDGLLSLDDPINKYIPNFAGNEKITIQNLLVQTSGDDGKHGNGGHNVVDFENLDDWISDWSKKQTGGTFGEFTYSNFNYGALAYIIEQVSGMRVEDFITQRIIKPLGLADTYVGYSPDSIWASKVSSRYQWNGEEKNYKKFWTNKNPQSTKFYSGSIGLWTTAKDYAAFIQMWLNNGKYNGTQLLSESTVENALKMHVNAYGEAFFGHGYGWFIDIEPLVFRYGGSAGSVAIAYPAVNTIVVYLTHSSGGDHKSMFQDELDKIWFPNNN